MLLKRERGAEFSKLPLADPATHALAPFRFGVASRDEVDTVADAAIAAGAEDHDDADDHGVHVLAQLFDPAAAQLGPDEVIALQQANATHG
jgi:predicted lactoylglutathione lyase